MQMQIEETREMCIQYRVQLRINEEKIQIGVISVWNLLNS